MKRKRIRRPVMTAAQRKLIYALAASALAIVAGYTGMDAVMQSNWLRLVETGLALFGTGALVYAETKTADE